MNANELALIAVNYLKGFFPDVDKVQLEEIEITDDNKYWNITLSYESQDTSVENSLWLGNRSRKFKIFKIGATSGEVRSMKIRDMK